MSAGLRLCTLCFLGLVVGCGRGISTADPGPEPPHGGTLVVLPDGSGVVEVVKKKGDSPITSEVAFYFFKDASYTPFDPAPESGVLVIDAKWKVSLEADGDALITPTGPVLF